MFYQHVFWHDVPTFDPGSSTYPDNDDRELDHVASRFLRVDDGRWRFRGCCCSRAMTSSTCHR